MSASTTTHASGALSGRTAMTALEEWQRTECRITMDCSHTPTEDEVREFLGGLSEYIDLGRLAIAELEATIERLKCCGNCTHIRVDRVVVCAEWELEESYPYVAPWNRCQFIPSRWQPREEAQP